MATFILTVDSPGEVSDLALEACHRIVDDGRLWDLITDAVAELGTEDQGDKFAHAGDLHFRGEIDQFMRHGE